MKAKDIQELIDFIAKSELDEVNLETSDIKLNIKRNSSPAVVAATVPTVAAPQPVIQPQATTQQPAPPTETQQATTEEQPTSSTNLVEIKSPMIGTFYRASNPETPPFVNIGDVVTVGQPVCIVEAMKLFNEIESEVSGKIVKVLVDNASPVEYDQPLFLVEPN